MSNVQKAYRQFLGRVTLPVATLVVLLLGALLATFIVVAWYQTAIALREQARLAEGALAVRARHLQRSVDDYGTWDEALQNLVTVPDPRWIKDNIGESTFKIIGFDISIVIAPSGEASYVGMKGSPSTEMADLALGEDFQVLLDRQRDGPRDDTAWGLITVAGRAAIAAVAPIRPEAVDPKDGGLRSRLAFVSMIDSDMLKEMAEVYLLPDLTWTLAPAAGQAFVPLTAADGSRIGFLAWTPARPGDTLLRAAVPVWIGLALGFGLLTLLIFRQARAAARSIGDSEHRASHDPLTGLANRVLLFERLDAASREVGPEGDACFALLYLDLDGFKPVNDSHGHEVGDEILRQVADRMRAWMGPADTAARLGGDEFALILPGRRSPNEIQEMAHRLIAEIKRPILAAPGVTICVGATIGVSFAPSDGADPLLLLRRADQALYLGKRAGRSQVRFHTDPAAQKRAG